MSHLCHNEAPFSLHGARHSLLKTTEEDEIDTFPSWCPPFTNRDAVRQGLRLKPLWTGLPDEDGFGNYSAAGNLAIPMSFDTDVAGFESQLSVQILRHIRLTVSLVGPAYNASAGSSKRELLDAMNGTPVSMRSSLMGFLGKESVLGTWSRLAEESSEASLSDNGSSPTKRDGDLWIRDAFKNLVAAEVPNQLHDDMRKMAYTRRKFFKTQCVSFGLGPEDFLEEDEINVALGCETPVILRKRTGNDEKGAGHYSYIGQAYIEHLMVYEGRPGR
ncbi:hypothetical protein PG994_009848 [Apiospora phragmitis]|uniref:Uncharacterized protein n=1 Tax=Apiospora phragmitis TaxID=2905665 RepID=A0ABR1TN68_9PEZI